MTADATPEDVDQIVGEVRVLREQLHELVGRLHDERLAWEKGLTELQRRPRLTASQRTRFRRQMAALARRRAQ